MCYCVYKYCRENFTQMQYERIRDAALKINYCNEVVIENDFIMDPQSSLEINK